MALVFSINNCNFNHPHQIQQSQSFNFNLNTYSNHFSSTPKKLRLHLRVVNGLREESTQGTSQYNEENSSIGVKAALCVLKFYKSEISPLLPKSCRYVPTCSEYSMIAYKKYGFTKGTILTTWRICRCNPLGSSGYDPPRWFDEPNPPEQ